MNSNGIKIMDSVDIAWVAGIIEGEGCIAIPRIGIPRRSQYPSIRVAMTDEDVIRQLQQVTGVGTISTKRAQKAHYQMQWQWSVGSRRDVARLLCAIAPLMGERRRARIAEAAERLVRPSRWGSGPTPPAEHGTVAANRRHYRCGEKPCESCRVAMNIYNRAHPPKRSI